MAFTIGENINNSQALGRYLVAIIPQFLDDDVKSVIGVHQPKPHCLK
jgi:hypothetical protein